MLRISEKDDEIILRDIALKKIILSGVMLPVIFLLLYFGFINIQESPFMFVVGILSLIIDIYRLSFLETKTIKINKQKRILSVNTRSLVKNVSHIYRFGEINDLISVEKIKDKDGNRIYKLFFLLETGEKIELSGEFSSNEDKYFEAADVINHFIFSEPKKIPQTFTGFNKL